MSRRHIPRHLLRRGAVVGAVILALAITSWAPALAASGDVVDVGWWTRNPGQSAPDGGFAVSLAPDGNVTVAAVRVDAASSLRAVTIEAVETGGVGQGSAAISVCAAAPSWEATAGGALADAPAADCAGGAVALERDAAAASWSADVSSLVVGRTGAVSLALVPTPDQGPLAAFDVRFAAPITMAVNEVESSGDVDGGGGGSSDDGAAPAFGGSTDEPASSPSGFGGFEPAPPAADPLDVPAADADAPPAEPAAEDPVAPELPDTADDEFAQPLVPASSGGGATHRTPGRALLFVVISALAGIAVAGGSRLARMRGLAVG